MLEERVRYWMQQLQAGKDIPAAAVIQKPDGRFEPLRPEDACKIEARERLGHQTSDTYVIAADTPPDRLEALRKELDRVDAQAN
jgi:hypothetical protein